jgi:hypothetical protein
MEKLKEKARYRVPAELKNIKDLSQKTFSNNIWNKFLLSILVCILKIVMMINSSLCLSSAFGKLVID